MYSNNFINNLINILFVVIVSALLTSCFETPSGEGLPKSTKPTPLTYYENNRKELRILTKAREHYENNEYEKAIKLFEDGAKAFPKDVNILFKLGDCYYNTKMYNKAKRVLANAVTILPEYGKAYVLLGRVFLMENDFENAEKLWLDALKINPRLFDAYYHLIKYYYYLGKYEVMNNFIAKLRKNGGELTSQITELLQQQKK